MDSHDEKLTVENVDELVVRELAQLRVSQPSSSITSLSRTIRNLQIICEEQRRLENVWERINNHPSALQLIASSERGETNEAVALQPLPLPAIDQIASHTNGLAEGNGRTFFRKSKSERQPQQRRWRRIGTSLIAAMLLVTLVATFLVWPQLASHLPGTLTGSAQTPAQTVLSQTQTATPTQPPLAMREYSGRYFKIQYPASWVITSISSESTASSVQTVQFRPSPKSVVEIDVSVMPESDLSINQLLKIDPQVKLYKLSSTHTATYNQSSWAIGIVNRTNVTPSQANKLEIAYSKQPNPYRIELAATADTFEQYASIFNTMLASFHPKAIPAATPTAPPSNTATPTPVPTEDSALVQIYIGQYFKIRYPAGWVITNITTDGTSLQTVQFRPSATSDVFVNVHALSKSSLSASQLLNIDLDVSLGTLLSTSTVTYHGIQWSVGLVSLLGSLLTPPSKLKVAYSNQQAPYKIEFSAPPASFSAYSAIFDSMFASFYPENQN